MPLHLIALDLYQTAGMGVIALLLGFLFTRSILFVNLIR